VLINIRTHAFYQVTGRWSRSSIPCIYTTYNRCIPSEHRLVTTRQIQRLQRSQATHKVMDGPMEKKCVEGLDRPLRIRFLGLFQHKRRCRRHPPIRSSRDKVVMCHYHHSLRPHIQPRGYLVHVHACQCQLPPPRLTQMNISR